MSGVILFEETLGQKGDDGAPLPQVLREARHPAGHQGRQGDRSARQVRKATSITQGLDGLADRLKAYKAQGARFTKWREVYPITDRQSDVARHRGQCGGARALRRICQEQGLVPIVEPEVLIDGDHSLERCAEVSEAVLHAVFHALHRHRVVAELIVLKPNMVVPGKANPRKASPEEVAAATLRCCRRTVPASVPTINFLSGGQSPEEATANLNAMNAWTDARHGCCRSRSRVPCRIR